MAIFQLADSGVILCLFVYILYSISLYRYRMFSEYAHSVLTNTLYVKYFIFNFRHLINGYFENMMIPCHSMKTSSDQEPFRSTGSTPLTPVQPH